MAGEGATGLGALESPGQRVQTQVFSVIVIVWLFNKAIRPQGLS